MAKPNPASLDAFIIVQNCERYLVIQHSGIDVVVRDEDAAKERSAVEMLDSYCAEYQAELRPHIAKVTKLRALALNLRKLQPKPRLP